MGMNNPYAGYYDPRQVQAQIQDQYQRRLAEVQSQYPQFFNQGQAPMPQQPYAQQQMPMPMQTPPAIPTIQNADAARNLGNMARYMNVSSIDQVKAYMADPLGTMSLFMDNKQSKIYTKQINNEGEEELKMYSLEAIPTPVPEVTAEYVNKNTFDQFSQSVQSEINSLREVINNARGPENTPSPETKSKQSTGPANPTQSAIAAQL